MPTIIKLGGVNGSGKTTVARAIIKAAHALPAQWAGNKKTPNMYVGDYQGHEVLVLGSYETACGGMDTISDKDERLAMVKWAAESAAKGGIVFFEGLITGKTYGALGALSEEHYAKGWPWLYAFMETPFDVCVERVLARRKAAERVEDPDKPFDPERTMRPTYESCLHLWEKLSGVRTGRTPVPLYHKVQTLRHIVSPVTLAHALLTRAVQMGRG